MLLLISLSSSQESLRFELKAETLLTSLLREKLYFKESEVEQLQAEIAAAVRGNDILRCEVGNALDNLACVSHQLKNLDLQVFLDTNSAAKILRYISLYMFIYTACFANIACVKCMYKNT
jgi:ABC-type transporter Mla subunit MlaD